MSSKATRDEEILNRVYRRTESGGVVQGGGTAGFGQLALKGGLTGSMGKGAVGVDSILAAENPKYRGEALKTAEEAGGKAVVESLAYDGACVGIYISEYRYFLVFDPSYSLPSP